MDISTPNITSLLDHIVAALPFLRAEMVLVGAFVLSICSGLFLDKYWKHSTAIVTVLGMMVAIGIGVVQPAQEGLFFGMLVPDTFSIHARWLIALSCILFALFLHFSPEFSAHNKRKSDAFTLLLGIHLALNLMVMTTHWLLVFISMEMISIGSYVLTGYLAKEARQTEAALKYALFGAVCSAVMLYGLTYLYGLTGNLDFSSTQHVEGLGAVNPVLVAVAIMLVFTGVGFKLSFFPFHFWVPDVYQGAPTPVTAFLSTAPKIAVFVLLMRILTAWQPSGYAYYEFLFNALAVTAILTMLLGNLAALRQQEAKRMMAYSSIGHTGFLMMAVLAYTVGDTSAILFYLAVYVLMNMGAFFLIDKLFHVVGSTHLSDYRGLGRSHPIALTCFVVILVSLVGLPPTAGFIAKLLVFSNTYSYWQASGNILMIGLLVTGALTTVVSLFYYFKIPLYAFLKESDGEVTSANPSPRYLWLIVLIAILLLVLGVFPNLLTALLLA